MCLYLAFELPLQSLAKDGPEVDEDDELVGAVVLRSELVQVFLRNLNLVDLKLRLVDLQVSAHFLAILYLSPLARSQVLGLLLLLLAEKGFDLKTFMPARRLIKIVLDKVFARDVFALFFLLLLVELVHLLPELTV